MSDLILIVFLSVLVILLVVNVAVFRRFFASKNEAPPDSGMKLLLEQMNELSRTVDSKIGEASKVMDQSVRAQFGESQKLMKDITTESKQLIQEITKELTEVKSTGKQVVGFAEELQNLQDILQNPKQRGILGEYYLETVLKNVLPPGRFQMQYRFNDGEIVDAAVFLDRDKILPVDSKFSLENYNRIVSEKDPNERERLEKVFKQDLKLRIDETAKYIRPKEGTMDFAFMFIPSEGIYYDLLINQVGAIKTSTKDLIEYAFQKKKVIIVSPTSFMAYLQTVLQGLRSLQIEESAKQIIKNVGELERHLSSYSAYHNKLGNAISTTFNHFNASSKEFKKIDKDVLKITGDSSGIEIDMLERPEQEG